MTGNVQVTIRAVGWVEFRRALRRVVRKLSRAMRRNRRPA